MGATISVGGKVARCRKLIQTGNAKQGFRTKGRSLWNVGIPVNTLLR